MPQLFALTANDRQELRQVVQTVNGTGRGVAPLSLRRRIIYSDAGETTGPSGLALGIVTQQATARAAGGAPFPGLEDLLGPCLDALGNTVGKADICGTDDGTGNLVEVDIVSAQEVPLQVGKSVILLIRGTLDPTLTYPAIYADIEDYLYANPTYIDSQTQVLFHRPGGGLEWGATPCP